MTPSRFRKIEAWRIKLPLKTTYVSSMYCMAHAFRTVLRVESECGHVGLGETLGNREVYGLVRNLAQASLGDDVHNRLGARRSFARNTFSNRNGRNGFAALAGLELARWDVAGRILKRPLCDLLGAKHRDRIAVVAPLPAGAFVTPAPAEQVRRHFYDFRNVDALVQYALEQRDRYGFTSFKYKSAAVNPRWDVAVMSALREALGPSAKLRFDPNAGYSVAQALRLCANLETLALEWYEDPTGGIEGLATLKRRLARPLATNMCVIQFDQIAPALARNAIDVLLADIYMWGGIEHYRDMLASASACGLEVAVHSLFESGIGTAANLHLAAAFPALRRANDSGAHMLARDVLHDNPLVVQDGHLRLPDGHGLGVRLDLDAIDAMCVERFVLNT